MTLTYRGKKYLQHKDAGNDASNKAALTYRGVSYAKWTKKFTLMSFRLTAGAFLFVFW